ncbi:MAG: pyridoxine 5'-phosphate synthase [Planctomycetota bacterium]|nr:MAG: pyridoxine 5'-phosphate synthase [Planctomycetota bacterium]
MPRLHVNIDHVATVRQARRAAEPDPVTAAALCELAGANGITVHLREDRRHIQDRDLRLLRETVKTLLNMESAVTEEMLAIAETVVPDQVCFVPEKRQELTTEGGLDVVAAAEALKTAVPRLQKKGIRVSLFIDPMPQALEGAAACGADYVELHTGAYANAREESAREQERQRLETAARYGHELGLRINAGHGLDYENIFPIAQLPFLEELNIGHAIVSRAVLVGLDQAVREMQDRILAAAPPEICDPNRKV